MPRYSIVITTVDRPQILSAALSSFLAFERDDIEILVSDNYSDERTAKVIAGFDDPRLRKFRTDHRMPMPNHWEWIWEQTKGDYVIYVGDDSTLSREALLAADEAIEKHDADIVSWRCCHYYHPDWDVQFKHLPNRGNILGIDRGFTNALYRVDRDKVIEHFTDNLRLAGCFPSVINFLLRRELGEEVRKRTGRLHWAPCPDISASYFSLGTSRPGKYIFWDGLGGIGGRSGQSNIASLLSRGKKSKRLREWLDEFDENNPRFPHHPCPLESISNLLAAPITQAAALLPEWGPQHTYSQKILALRSIDDTYYDRTVPWDDDPTYQQQLADVIASLDEEDRAEVQAYFDTAKAAAAAEDASGKVDFNPTPPLQGRGVIKFALEASMSERLDALKTFKNSGHNPIDKIWEYGGTTYVDQRMFGGETLAQAPASLTQLATTLSDAEPGFAKQYKDFGMLVEELGVPAALTQD